MAALYGRTAAHPANQTMIANVAYANRYGNGSIESGDGWRYRGRGPGLTFKNNYAACGKALGLDLVSYPDMMVQPETGCFAFGWFWTVGNRTGRDLGVLAEAGRIDDISRAVNGGEIGLQKRRDLFAQALRALA
jgi:putative chitinase